MGGPFENPASDYQIAPPIKDNSFFGIVTYVDFDCIIHVQDLARDNQFQEMVEKMGSYLSNIKPEPEDVVFKVGDLCSVYYSESNGWYRGKIRGEDECGTYR